MLVRLAISLILSAGALYYVLGGLHIDEVWQSMQSIHPAYTAAYIATLMFTQVARAMRWGILIQPFCKLGHSAVWRISNVGNMAIMLLPLRLGEFARPFLMKKEAGVSLTAGMGAAVVERVLDGLLVTLMFFVTTMTLDEQHPISMTLHRGSLIALAIFAGTSVAIVLTLCAHNLMQRLLKAFVGRFSPSLADKLMALLDAFVSGLRALPDIKASLLVIVWTLLYWCVNALGMYWLMCAFGWDVPVIAGFTVVCVLVIGIMVPAGPGFLGVYQAAIVAGLHVYNIPQVDALAYSFVAWLLNVAVVCSFGLPYFIGHNHLSVGDVVHADSGA
jgi:hypothetical protein